MLAQPFKTPNDLKLALFKTDELLHLIAILKSVGPMFPVEKFENVIKSRNDSQLNNLILSKLLPEYENPYLLNLT